MWYGRYFVTWIQIHIFPDPGSQNIFPDPESQNIIPDPGSQKKFPDPGSQNGRFFVNIPLFR